MVDRIFIADIDIGETAKKRTGLIFMILDLSDRIDGII